MFENANVTDCSSFLGPLPLGYSYEAKRIADDTHQLPVPVGQDVPDNTEQVLLDLVAFLLVIFVI